MQPSPLAYALTCQFQDSERRRRDLEQRWLKDLRQYKGIYDPPVASRLHPQRSKAFLRLTRAKVRLADARLMDLISPGSGESAWSVRSTPVPELPEHVRNKLLAQLTEKLGRQPTPQELNKAESAKANSACAAMERTMRDQLAECTFRNLLRDVIHSGNLYGTGVLKGPLVEERLAAGWQHDGLRWSLQKRQQIRPFVEFVPLWDIYPDMNARRLEESTYIFQRHALSAYELLQLAERPDFDGEAIRFHLREHPLGDADRKPHEDELRDLNEQGQPTSGTGGGRFQLLEYWGYLSGQQLASAGVQLEPGQEEMQVPSTAWVLGEQIIKIAPSPLEGIRWPYYFYHFDKDETGIFGEGLASIMRDPQQLFNASVRALLDNAAIAAGPQIEVNQDLLPENEDPTEVHPFRIWLRSGRGADAGAPAVRVTSLPSHTEEFMAMAKLFESYAHETTGVPGSMQVEASSANRTARGLSMLLSAASVSLVDQVKHFDDGVIRPFITALYHWNMQFNDNEELKGDYRVEARGWSSLVAKELSVEQLDAFASSTANSLDAPYIRREELLRRRAVARGLSEDIIRREDELEDATR